MTNDRTQVRAPRKFFWGGFENGKLAYVLCDQRFSSYSSAFMPAVFRLKKNAKEQFEDVRKVYICDGEAK